MKLTDEEIRTIYNYLSREWLHYDDQAPLRALLSRMGQYLEEVEGEISTDIINDEGE